MILLDPDLEPEPPHGRRPVRGGPGVDPSPKTETVKPSPASTLSASKSVDRDFKLPSARTLARFLAAAQAAVRLRGQVTVLLTTDASIRGLNRRFRGKNKATDVLSFPAEGLGTEGMAGDLAISVTTALRQASGQSHSLSTEIKVLILHGLLHLAGYDHEVDDGKMARRERLLRAKLRLPQGLIERTVESKRPDPVQKKRTSGAKARSSSKRLAARVNSCPDTMQAQGEDFQQVQKTAPPKNVVKSKRVAQAKRT
jgi:probable rRNA maturation factor